MSGINVSKNPKVATSFTVKKTITFDGTAGKGAVGIINVATVTGLLRVNPVGYCKTSLVSAGGGTLALGTSSSTNGLLPATTATNISTSAKVWRDTGPSNLDGVANDQHVTENVILTVGTADITSGSIEVVLTCYPLSTNANLI